MLVHCPACQARYNVPEKAIGPNGRQLRCAKCSHEWRITRPETDTSSLPAPEAGAISNRVTVATPSAVTPAPETPSETSHEPSPEALASTTDTSIEMEPSASGPTPEPVTTPAIATIARVRRTPAFLRRSSSNSTNDRSVSLVLVLLALLIPCFLAFLFWPYLSQHLMSSSTPQTPEQSGFASNLSRIPPQPSGLQLADITHTLERVAIPAPSSSATSPTTSASLTGSVRLLVSGLVENTTSQTIILPDLRVQLFDAAGHELDNWPASFTDSTLQPGQTTRWQAGFPAPAFRQLKGYRAFFAAPPTSPQAKAPISE